MSPVPKASHQRQMPGSRLDWYGCLGAGPSHRSKSSVGRRVGRLLFADGFAQLAVPRLGDHHVANDPFLEHLDRFEVMRTRPALGADLDDLLVAAGGLDHEPALADVVAARLLDINVLAGVAGEDRGRGVPVVGRGDPHGVHALIVEDLPHVLDGFRLGAGQFLGRVDGLGEAVGIHVADVGDADILAGGEQFQVIGPHAARTDDADGDLVTVLVRVARVPGPGQRRGGRGDSPGLLQKLSAVALVHGRPRSLDEEPEAFRLVPKNIPGPTLPLDLGSANKESEMSR